jgi:hypothetical protein
MASNVQTYLNHDKLDLLFTQYGNYNALLIKEKQLEEKAR